MTEPRWLIAARAQIGQKEIHGRSHNPRILQWWISTKAPFTDDETPWCAGFVGGMLESVGIRSSRSAAALSYAKWGVRLDKFVRGCIVVFSRKGGGHVMFGLREGKTWVDGLGGNQGDEVNERRFQKSGSLKLVGYFWPKGEPLPSESQEGDDIGGQPVQAGGPVTLIGNYEQESWLQRKWKAITGWSSGIGGLSFLGYLTDWQIVALLLGFILLVAILVVCFMGPGDVRAWIKKQVNS